MQVHKVLRQRVTDKALCSKKRVEQSIGLVQIGKHLVQTEFRQSLSALVQDAWQMDPNSLLYKQTGTAALVTSD